MEAAAVEAEVWPPVLGIDPGSTSTGLALRAGTAAVMAVTVARVEADPGDHRALVRWSRQVIDACQELADQARPTLDALAVERGESRPPLRHGVETLTAPTPRPVKGRQVAVAPRVLESLPGAAGVLCAVGTRWPRCIPVPPRGSAEGGWEALPGDPYPPNLRGRTPEGWLPGGADRSHQRSAWALAGVAHALDLARQQQQPAPTALPTLPEQVRAVVAAVVASRPDPADPAALVAAVRAAIQRAGAGDLIGREAQAAAACARGLGVEPGAVRARVQAWLEQEREGSAA